MLADLLGRPVSVPRDPENATAMGAFLIAAEALGLAEGSRPDAAVVVPRPERRERAARMTAAFVHGTEAVRGVAASR